MLSVPEETGLHNTAPNQTFFIVNCNQAFKLSNMSLSNQAVSLTEPFKLALVLLQIMNEKPIVPVQGFSNV